jgi:periplasmic protein TonB
MSGQRTPWDLSAARCLVSRAARKAPPGLAPRLEEEWLADLLARQGAFSRLRFGLGCCWATRVIAREFGCAAAAAGGPAPGQRLLVASGGWDFSRLSRRTTALIAIFCLHATVFYVYVSDFTHGGVVRPVRPTDVTFYRKDRPAPMPALLPRPTLTPTIVDPVPKPDVPLEFPPQPQTITVARSPAPAGASPPYPKPVDLVSGGPGAGFPNTESYYPAAARRLGAEGAAAVRVCVDPNGRLTADPTIVQSSGSAQLDRGALRLARAGSGRYRPTTANGRPITACYAFRVRFELDDR